MRIVGERRYLLPLVAAALLLGTVVEEASSRRGILWTLRVFDVAPAGPATSDSAAPIKRQAPDQVAYNSDPAVLDTASVEAGEAPQASQKQHGGDVVLPATSLLNAPDRMTSSQSSGDPAERQPQASAGGFTRTGINPLVLLWLAEVGYATDGVNSESSAVDSSTAMRHVFGTEVMTTLKPSLGAGLFSNDVPDITAGITHSSWSWGGVADAPRTLSEQPVESKHESKYEPKREPESKHQPESFPEGSVVTLSYTMNGPGKSDGWGPKGDTVDPTILPAAVVLGAGIPESPDDLRSFVEAYYGPQTATPLQSTALGLELNDGPGAGAALVNPEPGTLVLLGSGLFVLTHWARGRNRRISRRATQ